MDYCEDLSYYSRFHFENARNVGFGRMTGVKKNNQLPAEFMTRLLKYLKYPLNSVRGGTFKTVQFENIEYTLGFSEIRVLDGKGRVYAAPDEIVANILTEDYLPPKEFVDAVMYGVSPDSDEYQTYLRRYRPEYCWGASNAYVADVVGLVELISSGNLRQLKKLLEERRELLELVTGNGSLLNEAITRGREDIALYLLDSGISLERFEGIELLTAVESGLESVVIALMDRNIPIKMDRPRNNPLFLAIGRYQNRIAEFLYRTNKSLVTTYNTEFTRDCNILQWTKMCNNTAFMDFLMKLY